MKDSIILIVALSTLLINVIGVSFLVFKGGRHLGEVTQILKALTMTQKELKENLKSHEQNDREDFKEVRDNIIKLKGESCE